MDTELEKIKKLCIELKNLKIIEIFVFDIYVSNEVINQIENKYSQIHIHNFYFDMCYSGLFLKNRNISTNEELEFNNMCFIDDFDLSNKNFKNFFIKENDL